MRAVDTPRIAIVGAGIAGLTVAVSLRHAGIPCEVFEQASFFADAGAGIQISPNGARILHRLGLADTLQKRSSQAWAIETRRWQDDTVLGRTELGPGCVARFGAPYYLIQRADLHRTLVEALPAGTIRQGVVCTHVVEQDNGAVLHFRDGTTVTADLVIGADGIHSVVRRGLIADTPIFSGFTVYRGLVPIDRVPHLFDRPQVLFWLGPGGHVTSYPIVSRQLIHFSAVIASPDWDPKVWSAPGQVADAVAAFQGWTDTVRDLIGAADTVTRWALFDREPTGRWHGQRTVLVGDAAHPMLPFMSQGANQAIEDAATLVTLLVRAGLERDAALQAYQTLRQPRVAEVHRHARIRGRTFHFQDGEQQRQRDAAMPKTEDIGSYEWLYGFDAEQLPLDRAGAVSESPLRR